MRNPFVLLALSLPVGFDVGGSQPNIVLVMADDLGAENLACYGKTTYSTPHLDRMAGRMVHAMDAIAGRLLRQLEKLDIDQNTLVIFTGDNGTGGSLVSRLGDLHVRGGNFKNAQDRTRGVKSTEISARKDRD